MTLNSRIQVNLPQYLGNSGERMRKFRLNKHALTINGVENGYVSFNQLSLIRKLTDLGMGLEVLSERENPFVSKDKCDKIYFLVPEPPLQGYGKTDLLNSGISLSHILFRNPNCSKINLLEDFFGKSITNYTRSELFNRNIPSGVYSVFNGGVNISIPLEYLDSEKTMELLDFNKQLIYETQ